MAASAADAGRRAAAASEPVAQAEADLAAAGERQKSIDALMAKETAALEKLVASRKGKPGRPDKAFAAKKVAIEGRISRLGRGLLPGESEYAPRNAEALRASATANPQHHAHAGAAPAGRGVKKPVAVERTGVGVAADDGAADPAFGNFYTVPKNQRAFNEQIAKDYNSGALDRRASFFDADDLVGGGCQAGEVGVGRVHVFAPNKHVGLPLPPCPRCGWPSVDQGKVHANGTSLTFTCDQQSGLCEIQLGTIAVSVYRTVCLVCVVCSCTLIIVSEMYPGCIS